MVLSNKKLKQKLREAKTEQLTASETQINSTNQKNVKIPENPSGKTQDSIQSLLKTVTQKPRLSKREKRRVNLQSLPEKIKALRESDVGEVKKDGVDGVVEESKKRKRVEGEEKEGEESVEVKAGEKAKKKEKKKKKRKREEGEGKEGDDGLEVKEGEKAEKAEKAKQAKKKKKKQKKRKGKKKVEDGEVKEVVESGGEAKAEPGGAMAEPVVVETSKITERYSFAIEETKILFVC